MAFWMSLGGTGGQRLVQLQLADDVTQGRSRQIFDGVHGVFHTVGIELGVGDLKIEDSVDLHGDVVLGDHGLGREICHLFLQGDHSLDSIDKGELKVKSHAPNSVERAQALDDIGL